LNIDKYTIVSWIINIFIVAYLSLVAYNVFISLGEYSIHQIILYILSMLVYLLAFLLIVTIVIDEFET